MISIYSRVLRLICFYLMAAGTLLPSSCTTGSGVPEIIEVEAPPIPRSKATHGIDPERVLIPVSGAPLAVAHLVQGGLRAEHGSHFGFKAIVDESTEGTTPPGMLYLAHGSALNRITRAGQMVDRSRVEILTTEKGTLDIENRSLHFEPWMIQEKGETAELGTVRATSCQVDTNIQAVQVWVENLGDEPLTVQARLRFDCDPDPVRERWKSSNTSSCPEFSSTNRDPYTAEVSTDGNARIFRGIKSRFAGRNTTTSDKLLITADVSQDDSAWVRSETQRLYSGGAGTFTFFVSASAQMEEAIERLEIFDASSDAAKAHKLCALQKKNFSEDLLALPPTENERDARLQILAVDALRHARYAPAGSMPPRFGAVAAKPLDVRFTSNDLAKIAAGSSLLSSSDPIDYLKLMVSAAYQQSGRLPPYFDENLQPACRELCEPVVDDPIRDKGTAHPILIWALAATVAGHPNIYSPTDLDPIFQGMVRILSNMEDTRIREEAFFSATSEESGWEDSPRFSPLPGLSAPDVDDVERTAWMARAYKDLADLADAMMLASDQAQLLKRYEEIQTVLNETFRDSDSAIYADRLHTESGMILSTVRTPASIIPGALGLSDDPGNQATSNFILDGNALWGTWEGSDEYMMPVPSVAYHEPQLGVYEDGHRLKGQIWPWQVYMAWRALVFADRQEEAERLRYRFLEMVDKWSDQGLYECYDFLDGAPGFGPQGRKSEESYAPAVIQHAVSAAAVLRILHRL